jgi:hypothetical protein
MRMYLENNRPWFSDFPDRRASIGGRFANFILCRGEHLSILTPSYLRELCEEAGFEQFRVCAPGTETGSPEIFDSSVLSLEQESSITCPHTLVIEASRPN